MGVTSGQTALNAAGASLDASDVSTIQYVTVHSSTLQYVPPRTSTLRSGQPVRRPTAVPGLLAVVPEHRSMPERRDDLATDPEVHRWEVSAEGPSAAGVSWIAHPDERMRRASHALAVDGDVWVVEPVDAAGLDDLLADLGVVTGVVVLADYHRRDAAAVAARQDVAVHLPDPLAGLADEMDAPVQVFDDALADTGYRVVPLLDGLPWTEVALHDPSSGTLVATESLVTSDGLTAPGERLAFTPYVRLAPPRAPLRGRDVQRVLVGHGPPVVDDAAAALADAISNARTGAPRAIAGNLPYLLWAAYVAARD